MIQKFALLAYLVSSSLWLASAVSSPEQYFGGQDNDAYLEWVGMHDYPSTAFLPSSADPTKGAAIHWSISGDYLELGIAVKASGWMGFGLTVNGGMTGSDMVLFEAANPNIVKDAYVQDQRSPVEDDCQDWQMLNSTIDSSFLMVQVRRKLDTGDNQDLVIHNDADVSVPVSRVIAAWGEDETVTYHGPNIAKGSIRWFSTGELEEEVFEELMKDQADGKFIVGAQDHPIPVLDTEYAYFCFDSEDLEAMDVPMKEGVTMIGFNPIINNTKHLHHFVLKASFLDIDNSTACTQGNAMGDITYVWAPGEPPFAFPEHVGFELGGSNGYRSFVLEIHYDNVDLAENEFDSSGVEIFYSVEPREFNAGFFVAGDGNVGLMGQEIAPGLTDYNFNCPEECSGLAIGSEPVTVIREFLHMHKSGYSTSVDHIRQGEVIRKASVEYYDFAQTGGPAVQQEPFQIFSGDSFNMKCFYKNEEEGRKFGLGSSDEMCMAFFLYYPRKSIMLGNMSVPWMCGVGFAEFGLPACDSAWTTQGYPENATLNRTFGTPSTSCSADFASVGGDESAAFMTSPLKTSIVVVVALMTQLLLLF